MGIVSDFQELSQTLAPYGTTWFQTFWMGGYHKPEKRILEVEGQARDLHLSQHASLASDSV